MDGPHPSQRDPSGSDDLGDGWEYECDERETEDLYFTLDLTTLVPDALMTVKQNGYSHPITDDTAEGEDDQQHDEPNAGTSPHHDPPKAAKTLQIIGLHTRSPFVKLDDEVYSCHWSTDLGTQVHVARAGAIKNPLREGHVLDIVGLSQARLIGKPVTLQRRPTPRRKSAAKGVPEEVIEEDLDEESSGSSEEAFEDSDIHPPQPSSNVLPTPGEPLVIPRSLCKDTVAEEQASFLERLSAIKVKKGEFDTVPIYNVKHYTGPSEEEQEEIRQRALEADMDAAREARMAKKAVSGAKKRRRGLPAGDDDGLGPRAKQGERANAKRGRPPAEDIRAGLGYQSDNETPDSHNDERVHTPANAESQ